MIICAAIKIQMNNLSEPTIVHCFRHAYGFKILHDLVPNRSVYGKTIDGFVTHTGEFLDRKEALAHAIECGQLNQTVLWHKEDHNEDELYSEDLY